MTPREFFDQFPPLADGAEWTNTQWCPRHWAPCPLLKANGIGAAVEVMEAWLGRQTTTTMDGGAEALNARLAEDGPLCCQLGDDKMYEIWGHWPPAPEDMPAHFA